MKRKKNNHFPTPSISRREFLKGLLVSMGVAQLSSCNIDFKKDGKPHYSQGEIEEFYTSISRGLDSLRVSVRSYKGVPFQVVGAVGEDYLNTIDAIYQSSIVDLYKSSRLKYIKNNQKRSSLTAFRQEIRSKKEKYQNNRGEGLCLLTEVIPSKAYTALLSRFQKEYPLAKIISYEDFHPENIYEGVSDITNKKALPIYNFEKADIIVSFDCDFLGTQYHSLENNRLFFRRRGEVENPNRLYMFEATQSTTGAKADHRFKVQEERIVSIALSLLSDLIIEDETNTFSLADTETLQILQSFKDNLRAHIKVDEYEKLIEDIISNKEKVLFCAGSHHSKVLHSVVMILNYYLSKDIVEYSEVHLSYSKVLKEELLSLQRDFINNKIKDMFIVGINPAYNFPIDMKNHLENMENIYYLSDIEDETSLYSNWNIPKKHFFEKYSDIMGLDGRHIPVQPLIEPMYKNSLSENEFLFLLLDEEAEDEYIMKSMGIDFKEQWNEACQKGEISERKKLATSESIFQWKAARQRLKNILYYERSKKKAIDHFEILFKPDPKIHDGRGSDNVWLQELSNPISKVTWGNAAYMSRTTMSSFLLKEGDIVQITIGQKFIEIPVYPMDGHVDYSVTLHVGYGRKINAIYGSQIGFDINHLRSIDHRYHKSGQILIQPTHKRHPVVKVENKLKKIEIYKNIEEIKSQSQLPQKRQRKQLPPEDTVMYIDLSKCNGCGACEISCLSENNIASVGKENIQIGHQMKWINVHQHILSVEDGKEEYIFQPMLCQQCNEAPCEASCPTQSIVQNENGISEINPSTCAGSTQCIKSCPFEVISYNKENHHQKMFPRDVGKLSFLNQDKGVDENYKKLWNPKVSPRVSQVSEKCHWCIHKNPLKSSGENWVSACSKSCPTGAISFMKRKEAESKVSYSLGDELKLETKVYYGGYLKNSHKKKSL